MPQIRGHIIELDLNNKQKTYCQKAYGVARFAYNWALAEWQKQYQEDKKYRDKCLSNGIEINKNKLNSPTQNKLRKQLNAIKRQQFSWMLEVTKCSPQMAIIHLGDSFKRFFKRQAKYPQFKKKGVNDSFTLTNDQFKIIGKQLQIPKLGLVKMREKLRFQGKILSGRIFKRGEKWFLSVQIQLAQIIQPIKKTGKKVGIDLV